jgi:hypothetical protein
LPTSRYRITPPVDGSPGGGKNSVPAFELGFADPKLIINGYHREYAEKANFRQ